MKLHQHCENKYPHWKKVGLTEGSHCRECDEILIVQQEIQSLGHNVIVDLGYEATCTETGLTDGSHCLVCGEVLTVQETIEKLKHITIIDEAVKPTCTQLGKTEGKRCSVCGEITIKQETINRLPHSYIDNKCKICGILKVSAELEYKLNKDGQSYSVIGIGICKEKDIIVPNLYNDLPVTSIADGAFISQDITSIEIPSSVTNIGEGAFEDCRNYRKRGIQKL